MTTKKFKENSCFKTWIEANGICITQVKPEARITIKEALENSEFVRSLGEQLPLMVDTRNIVSITKEARDHFSMRGRKGNVVAIAILISSPVSKIIGNFFMGLNKPTVPTRLFTSEEKAKQWLKSEF